MIQKVNRIIEQEYEKIKDSGKILSGIRECARNIRYEEPILAKYVEEKLLKIAEEKGDLP